MKRQLWMMLSVCGLLLLTAGAALMQDETPAASPTPLVLGPVNVVTPTPRPPAPEDPRPAVCAAPFQSGWQQHLIRPGDTLQTLMTGVLSISVTQAAALNCLDDPGALPVGAVIWLPPAAAWEVLTTTPPVEGGAAPLINRVSADQPALVHTGRLTLSWSASGRYALLYTCPPDSADCPRPATAQPLPLTYTTPPIIGFPYAGELRFMLEVVGTDSSGAEAITRQSVTVTVTCNGTVLGAFSGAQPCPESTRVVEGAYQPFQRGMMIWQRETGLIWVFSGADKLQVFEDTYVEGEAEPALTAPAGLNVPSRGFGKVWRQIGADSSALGWATSPENAVTFTVQSAGRVSYTTYMQFPDEAVYAVTVLPGASSGWWVRLS